MSVDWWALGVVMYEMMVGKVRKNFTVFPPALLTLIDNPLP